MVLVGDADADADSDVDKETVDVSMVPLAEEQMTLTVEMGVPEGHSVEMASVKVLF